jgi:tetratricopeptide (TPR) repeat protein
LFTAGLDQLKFYYGAQASDAASLRWAQQLNSHDASLQMRLARANERDGNRSGARAALEEAVRINPTYRQAQTSLARLLIESNQFEQAYSHYRKMFALLTPDVDSLVNYGLLAAQLGHQDEAINVWRQALDQDTNQANAHLYLADALFQKQQFREAIPHYEQYLALITSTANAGESATPLPAPEFIVNVVLHLSKACHAVGEDQNTAHLIAQAVALAEKAGDPSALNSAFFQSAELKQMQGRQAEALADFQRALMLETSGGVIRDPGHWFKFGKFLRQARVSPRLVFACFAKAETLLGAEPDSYDAGLAASIRKELNTAAAELDAASMAKIKAQLDVAIQEALVLKLS